VPTLLTLAAKTCSSALARGDSRVIAGLGDVPSDLVGLYKLNAADPYHP
jgi:hypothetical protein